ncbi:MAG: DNA alkylation repair protein [Planctomycetota bacterium]
MPTLSEIKKALRRYANPKQARLLQGFFKTDPGEYGEGDVFLGLKVPQTRTVARQYRDLPLPMIERLLSARGGSAFGGKSPIHEERLLALLILVDQFQRADEPRRAVICRFYLRHTRYINNWDLVDLSASRILGVFLLDKDKQLLFKLARSRMLWERRIAVIATAEFIRHSIFGPTLRISAGLLGDKEDLIHKAVGWMLREVGKKDQPTLERFLKKHGPAMPRTMLRYAIERFPEPKRQWYLNRWAGGA